MFTPLQRLSGVTDGRKDGQRETGRQKYVEYAYKSSSHNIIHLGLNQKHVRL